MAEMNWERVTIWRDAHGDIDALCPAGKCRKPLMSGMSLDAIKRSVKTWLRESHPAGRCPRGA